MRPKLKEEDSEITKMSIPMLNYYQDAEGYIDGLEGFISHKFTCSRFDNKKQICNCGLDKLLK